MQAVRCLGRHLGTVSLSPGWLPDGDGSLPPLLQTPSVYPRGGSKPSGAHLACGGCDGGPEEGRWASLPPLGPCVFMGTEPPKSWG